MRLLSAALAVCLTVVVSADDPGVSQAIPKELAIFLAASESATTTSFTMEHTRITITKHFGARAASLTGARPKIVVTDAAARGLVCLPKGRLTKKDSAAAEAETINTSTSTEEYKSDTLIGQGGGVTAVASVGCVSASASVDKNDDSAASTVSTCADGGGSSAAASGGSAAAAAGADASAAASAGAGSSATASGESDASADASGSGSAAAATSGDSASVDVAGENAEAAATGADGSTVIKSSDIVSGYCECVPDYLCDEEGYINTFGAGIIDIRANQKKAIRTYDSRCREGQTCCRHREGGEREQIGWLPSTCGQRAPLRLDRRIVGGEAVRIGENPWMVALLKQVTGADGSTVHQYICGGSLIAEDIVLTGAHCVHDISGGELIARMGEWDTSTYDPVYPNYDIAVSQVVAHEKFNPKTLFNDVALLKLSEPQELHPHINTICLPTGDGQYQFDASDCIATGWGKESFENSVYSSILKEVPLSVVPNDQCQTALRTTRLSEYFKLDNSFMCAGGEPGVDTCKGDGGSPLVCRGPPDEEGQDTFVQVGIVAWGIGCGKDNIPGVYADVQKLLPWIQQNLAQLQGGGSGGY